MHLLAAQEKVECEATDHWKLGLKMMVAPVGGGWECFLNYLKPRLTKVGKESQSKTLLYMQQMPFLTYMYKSSRRRSRCTWKVQNFTSSNPIKEKFAVFPCYKQ